ncbi:MAG TPA: prevent-host-death protein [Betaproteobacteria bacterium]|nr:prevent-host-death protein [Betaproteobacteria bacterium]
MHIEIGSYKAKTKFAELLRGVSLGNRYTITLRGKAVAELIPSETAQKRDVAAAIKHMRHFIASQPPLTGIDTKALSLR